MLASSSGVWKKLLSVQPTIKWGECWCFSTLVAKPFSSPTNSSFYIWTVHSIPSPYVNSYPPNITYLCVGQSCFSYLLPTQLYSLLPFGICSWLFFVPSFWRQYDYYREGLDSKALNESQLHFSDMPQQANWMKIWFHIRNWQCCHISHIN
jgi:hypothetical protein